MISTNTLTIAMQAIQCALDQLQAGDDATTVHDLNVAMTELEMIYDERRRGDPSLPPSSEWLGKREN